MKKESERKVAFFQDMTIAMQQWFKDMFLPPMPRYAWILQVSEILIHPKYAGLIAVRYDVALLRLDGALDFVGSKGLVAPICLPRRSYQVKGDVIITGWGRTKEGEQIHSHRCNISAVTLLLFEKKGVTSRGSLKAYLVCILQVPDTYPAYKPLQVQKNMNVNSLFMTKPIH